MKEVAVEVEVVLGPDAAQRVDPLLALRVTAFVVARLNAEHFELALVPAAHDVQTEAALADVIGGNDLLRGDDRRK